MLGDEVLPRPLRRIGLRVVETKAGVLGLHKVPVEMLRPGAGLGVPLHKRRIEQPDDGRVRVLHLQLPDPVAPDVADPNRIGPPDRAQLSGPDSHPVAGLYPETRVELSHALDLRPDRRPACHFGGSVPKKVCDGAAKDLEGVEIATAGAARPVRTGSIRPEPRS